MTGSEGFPRSVSLLYWLFGMAVVGGSRFGARWLLWVLLRRRFQGRQVLLYGAGGAGRQLATSLRKGHELFPAGFLDDDIGLQGKDMDGLRVYAPAELSSLIARFDIQDVIICLPPLMHGVERWVSFLEEHRVRGRTLPAITDIVDGKHLVKMVREIDIGDLLGREVVAADPASLTRCIAGSHRNKPCAHQSALKGFQKPSISARAGHLTIGYGHMALNHDNYFCR